MAINRGPWNALIDDDGSNLIGSIWNKTAIKDVLLDPIDAMIATGAVTFTDASGAGLAITTYTGRYWKFDKLIVISGHLGYPATANGNSASIGGLPVPNGAAFGALYCGQAPVDTTFAISPGGSAFSLNNGATGAARTNAQVSSAVLIVAGVYLTA